MDVLVDEGTELQSTDPSKQINALVRILQLLTRGDQRILINVLTLSKVDLLSPWKLLFWLIAFYSLLCLAIIEQFDSWLTKSLGEQQQPKADGI